MSLQRPELRDAVRRASGAMRLRTQPRVIVRGTLSRTKLAKVFIKSLQRPELRDAVIVARTLSRTKLAKVFIKSLQRPELRDAVIVRGTLSRTKLAKVFIKRMTVTIALVVAAASALSSTVALAAEKNKDDSSRMVCKRIKETGSHFSRRVCMPKGRWDEMRKDVEDDIRGANPPASPAVPG